MTKRLRVCLGFDGSINNDHTGIRLETHNGWLFTPTYGPDRRPTWWDPAQWNGKIPRHEVRAAVDELFTVYDIERGYFDPEDWDTQIDDWALEHGEEHVIAWRTNRVNPMYDAIRRFETDLVTGVLTHDDCGITEVHVGNAVKVPKPAQKYVLGKPTDAQKIDMAMASILAHEAAADARAAGWTAKREDTSVMVFR